VDRQTNIVVDNAGNKPQTVKLESSAGTNSMGGGRTRYINGDLPSALQEDRKWTKVILPALLVWAGSLGDPWVIPDQDLVRALRTIISAVDPQYGDLNGIRPGEPIFVLVNQFLFLVWLNFALTFPWTGNTASQCVAKQLRFHCSCTCSSFPRL